MTDTAFTPEALAALAGPLDPRRVSVMPDGSPSAGVPYLEGHDVIQTANQIFGFGNWGFELTCPPWAERGTGKAYQDKPGQPYTVWMALGRLTVRGGLTFSDIGSNLQSGPGGSATEMSVKGAATDALKRCLRLYGNQFGLVLYDKGMGRADLEEAFDHAPDPARRLPPAMPRPRHLPQPAPVVTSFDPDTGEIADDIANDLPFDDAPSAQDRDPKTEWLDLLSRMVQAHVMRPDIVAIIGEFTPAAFARWMDGHAGRDASVCIDTALAAKKQAARA